MRQSRIPTGDSQLPDANERLKAAARILARAAIRVAAAELNKIKGCDSGPEQVEPVSEPAEWAEEQEAERRRE